MKIYSKYFQNFFKNSKVVIQAKAAQPLSAFIEKGDISSKDFTESLNKILSDLKIKPHSILLACTHYPAITANIQKRFPKTKILDPSHQVVLTLSLNLKKFNHKGSTDFNTTGNSQAMKTSALKAFGIKLQAVKKIKI